MSICSSAPVLVRKAEAKGCFRLHLAAPVGRTLRQRQQGVALIVVLVFITIMSLLSAFTIRRAFFGEGVAQNQVDLEVARQAAELALRDAELDISLPAEQLAPGATCSRTRDDRMSDQPAFPSVNFRSDCLRGQCAYIPQAGANPVPAVVWWPAGLWNNNVADKPSQGNPANCLGFVGAVPLGVFTGTPRVIGVSRQPEYLLELIQVSVSDPLASYVSGKDGKILFRVTARGFGLNPGSEVVLQTYLYYDSN